MSIDFRYNIVLETLQDATKDKGQSVKKRQSLEAAMGWLRVMLNPYFHEPSVGLFYETGEQANLTATKTVLAGSTFVADTIVLYRGAYVYNGVEHALSGSPIQADVTAAAGSGWRITITDFKPPAAEALRLYRQIGWTGPAEFIAEVDVTGLNVGDIVFDDNGTVAADTAVLSPRSAGDVLYGYVADAKAKLRLVSNEIALALSPDKHLAYVHLDAAIAHLKAAYDFQLAADEYFDDPEYVATHGGRLSEPYSI